jgi:hypothetical protein
MSAVINLVNLSRKDDDSVEIVTFDKITNQIKPLDKECTSISDYMMLLRNKQMDVVLYLDSVSIKKTGRDIALMPKIRIHQIILHDYVEKQKATVGLKLLS